MWCEDEDLLCSIAGCHHAPRSTMQEEDGKTKDFVLLMRRFLEYMSSSGLGTISEIFDGKIAAQFPTLVKDTNDHELAPGVNQP